ncbi:ParB domain protein nuclease [Ammonifex degensii KC4]|uniref:ParB domain protein nuclease n=1 Tax=Ammonifex degensii (strain DSM 10501 / KC4) TaxID=429009 RepID=C9RCB5_AMMDK|nr:ParB N-terminal domain-containing protein [Ammonifex degensii]ACX51892.1 ParB domain protein nuclease [Ammonifex degensii KC4]
MVSEVPVSLLKPHPKNAEYYSPPTPEEREALRRSIAAEGIRDPLKVTPDYTVIAGHVRLEIARELGLERVPVVIVDGPPEYLEYLLIADNDERRLCRDPIKKAKRAEFLKRYWGVREGSANPKGTVVPRQVQNAPHEGKTLVDVAEAIGESVDTTKRLLKLNDLIPELQRLVSQGKLSQTAAYSLAFLPPEEQRRLLKVLGETGVSDLSVKQAQELRKELEAERREKEALSRRLAELEEEKKYLSAELTRLSGELTFREEQGRKVEELRALLEEKERELAGLRRKLRELQERPVERVVEKVVYRTDPALEAELEAAREQAAKLLEEKEFYEQRFRDLAREKERKEAKLRSLEQELERLERRYEHVCRELKREKEYPKPPQWSKEHAEFRQLVADASQHACALAEALGNLLKRHRDRLLAAARVRGAPGEELGELVEVLNDTMFFATFKSSLNIAASRIVEVWEVLEPGKPKLQVLRGGKEKED